VHGCALAGFFAAIALLTAGCAPDRGDWVKENNRIIDSMPVYPGAIERVPRYTEARTGGAFASTQGYYTVATFSLRKETGLGKLVRYYASHRPAGWSCRSAGAAAITCLHGNANVDFLFLEPTHLYIRADKGYQDDKDART
jgi:hypothetical protein